MERLKQAGDLEAVGGAAYLAEVLHSVPAAAHAVYYAKIVRDKAMLRGLIYASTEILRSAYDGTEDVQDVLARAEQGILAVRGQRQGSRLTSIHEGLVEFILEMSRLELIGRLVCSRGRINGHRLRGGYLSADDKERLVQTCATLDTVPLSMATVDTICQYLELELVARQKSKAKKGG